MLDVIRCASDAQHVSCRLCRCASSQAAEIFGMPARKLCRLSIFHELDQTFARKCLYDLEVFQYRSAKR